MKQKAKNKPTVWVVTVVLRLSFHWYSKYAHQRLTSVRIVRAKTSETAQLLAAEMAKLHWEKEYIGDGLKKMEVDWTFAVDISAGKNTKLS